MNFNLDWDCSIIDLTVPGEKTKSLWSSRTSQLVRKIGNQNESIEDTNGSWTRGYDGQIDILFYVFVFKYFADGKVLCTFPF